MFKKTALFLHYGFPNGDVGAADEDAYDVFLSIYTKSVSVKILPGASSCIHQSFGPQIQPAIKYYRRKGESDFLLARVT